MNYNNVLYNYKIYVVHIYMYRVTNTNVDSIILNVNGYKLSTALNFSLIM